MSEAELFHKTKIVNVKYKECDLYIDRRSKWGNPFRIGPDGTREEVIAKFKEHILKYPHLIEEAKTVMKGKTLGCWCAPFKCHGHVWKELIFDGTDYGIA